MNPRTEEIRSRKELMVKLGIQTEDQRRFGKKYLDFKRHAEERGRRVTLTFTDYMNMAFNAGIKSPAQIGHRMGQYQVGRLEDKGDYEPSNCRFITKEENLNELRFYRYGIEVTNVI